jgi:Cof subfamily protein (haloacid dehalogenase superfamily)
MRRHLDFATWELAQRAGSGRVIRLAFIDLDGTLLAGPRHIAEPSIDAVSRARDAGVDVVLASARLPRYIAPYHEQLGLTTPIIACNGALLWDLVADVPLARASLDLGLAAEVVSLARHLGAIPNLESDDHWFADRVNDRILRNVERFGLQPPREIGAIDRILAAGGPADKVFVDIRDLAAHAAAARERLLRTLAGRATVTESVPGLLDIISLGASKAIMARRLARTLGVTADQVLAVGDGDNDVSLLAWAGIGVAMGNATPTVKAAADAVTSSNLRNGVAEALDRWALGPGGI